MSGSPRLLDDNYCNEFVQFAIVLERTIATICVRNYERGYTSLVPALLLITAILSMGMLMLLYYKESFDGPFLNARMLPPSTAALGNIALILLILLNLTALICAVALHYVNKRKRIRDTLSSKFQLMENRITADLLFWGASIQFISCVLNDIAVLMVRLYLSKSQYAMAFKENVDLVNIYTFILPVLTTIYLKKVKQRRLRDIKKNLGIKATGYEGWQNYSAYTQQQWK
ncbi:unnamed protein product [Cylicocyclus nassatus]|uniref:Uncharacterized protein n=1 Tax=Cylicocyclus nassatus TaxID=53992 RepID=A0AA36H311_CYLNA|nr:unnamed protein product [Cylicocyclus nassatus]